METIKIELLAEKIGGNLWNKNGLKRVYLDMGYNTKKMSTKTFIYELNGQFLVSCYIECNSQPYQWVKSQEEEIKESVYNKIEAIISDNVYIITNKDGDAVNDCGYKETLNDIYATDYYFYSELKAKEAINQIHSNDDFFIKKINKEEFEIIVEKLNI